MEGNWFTDLARWWSQLDALWKFLFTVPLLVAAAGLLAAALRRHKADP